MSTNALAISDTRSFTRFTLLLGSILALACRNRRQAAYQAAEGGYTRIKRATVSDGWAPFFIQWAIRSCFRFTTLGLAMGLYVPTTSRAVLSRARSLSITTTR